MSFLKDLERSLSSGAGSREPKFTPARRAAYLKDLEAVANNQVKTNDDPSARRIAAEHAKKIAAERAKLPAFKNGGHVKKAAAKPVAKKPVVRRLVKKK